MKQKIVLIVAIALGALAFLLTNVYLRTEREKLFASAKRVPIVVPPTDKNVVYMKTKKDKMGHYLDEIEDALNKKTPKKDDEKKPPR